MKGVRRDDFVEHVCDLLGALGSVRPKAMFGGYGIYVDEIFCAIVAYDTLYFKVDEADRNDYEAMGARPLKPFEDKAMVMSYYEVPAEVMDDRTALVEWGRKAMNAALRSGTKERTAPARDDRAPRSRAPTPGRRKRN